MNFWDYLRVKARQERAVQKVEEHVKLVLDEAQAIGQMHREHGRKAGIEE